MQQPKRYHWHVVTVSFFYNLKKALIYIVHMIAIPTILCGTCSTFLGSR